MLSAVAVTSREVQNHFGSVVDRAKLGEVISMTQHGRPAVFIIAHNQDSEDALRIVAARKAGQLLASLQVSKSAQALSEDDVAQLVRKLRTKAKAPAQR